jgi:nucleolar pre-ribosomal-associated protein 1
MPTFSLAAQAILRLGLLPGHTVPHIPALLTVAMNGLQRLEKTNLTFPQVLRLVRKQDEDTVEGPLYTSHGLYQPPSYEHPLEAWGISVEALWRVVMGLEEKHSVWDGLTSRLLLWRSVAGPDGSPMGEWARREVIQELGGKGIIFNGLPTSRKLATRD